MTLLILMIPRSFFKRQSFFPSSCLSTLEVSDDPGKESACSDLQVLVRPCWPKLLPPKVKLPSSTYLSPVFPPSGAENLRSLFASCSKWPASTDQAQFSLMRSIVVRLKKLFGNWTPENPQTSLPIYLNYFEELSLHTLLHSSTTVFMAEYFLIGWK